MGMAPTLFVLAHSDGFSQFIAAFFGVLGVGVGGVLSYITQNAVERRQRRHKQMNMLLRRYSHLIRQWGLISASLATRWSPDQNHNRRLVRTIESKLVAIEALSLEIQILETSSSRKNSNALLLPDKFQAMMDQLVAHALEDDAKIEASRWDDFSSLRKEAEAQKHLLVALAAELYEHDLCAQTRKAIKV